MNTNYINQVMSVYNYEKPDARNILSIVDANDKFLTEFTCTLEVEVETADFKQMYRGGELSVPYLEMTGYVKNMRLDGDSSDDVFPCGTKRMSFMDGQEQSVTIRYLLNVEEIQGLIGIGLYEYEFAPPANLVGNVLEIYGDINYIGVYETPCCIVQIEHAYDIITTTNNAVLKNGTAVFGNNYEGMLLYGCQNLNVDPDTVYSYDRIDYECPMSEKSKIDYDDFKVCTFIDKMEKIRSIQDEHSEPVLSDEQKAEIEYRESLDKDIKAISNTQSKDINNDNIKQLLESVHESANKATEKDVSDYDKFFGNDFSDENTMDVPVNENSIIDNYEILKQQAGDMTGSSIENKKDMIDDALNGKSISLENTVENNFDSDSDESVKSEEEKNKRSAVSFDIAQDNMALNEGNTDIAGYGTSSHNEEEKNKRSAVSFDIAQDNIALNEGNTDVAGHGTESNETQHGTSSSRVSDLLAGILSSQSANEESPDFK